MTEPTRKLAAIVFTDIAGFTAIASKDEGSAFHLIEQQRELLEPVVKKYGGSWLKEMGDGLLLSFSSTTRAVECAIKIQQATQAVEGLNIRIGIHQGEIIEHGGDVFGDDVNVASRIEPFAAAGGIAISDKIQRDIASNPEFVTKYIGRPKLKGVKQEVKVYCITSHGLPETKLSDVSAKLEKSPALWARYVIPIAMLVAVGLYLFTIPEADIDSIAVLPLDNLSDDPEQEYFVDGMTEALITELSKIGALKVISRTSVMQYKNVMKALPEIARELNVGSVVVGSALLVGDRVRITAQLIEATSDQHLWAESYDRDYADIFAIQSDVAQKIAAALKATLTPEEKSLIEQKPTDNMEAYDYYLRGNIYYHRSYSEQDNVIARQMYEKAVELDPNFALAFAMLSETHSEMYFFHYDRSEDRLSRAKEAVDKAFNIEPDLPQAYEALGYYYYWGHLDYDHALEQFTIARKRQPNNADLLEGIGYVQRRQGEFEQALTSLEMAQELNPHSASITYAIAETYHVLRDYTEAERYLDRAISLKPDWLRIYGYWALESLSWEGSTEKARALLEETSYRVGSINNPLVVFPWVLVDLFDGKYNKALDRLSSVPFETFETQFFYIPKDQLYAQIYGLIHLTELEQIHYDSARVILESNLQEQPGDARFHSLLGIAYAGLGRKEDAIREGKLAVELLPVSQDAWKGVIRLQDLAQIYVMVEEHKEAINLLEFLLSVPGPISIPLLRADPVWDPLQDHPRFQKLIAEG